MPALLTILLLSLACLLFLGAAFGISARVNLLAAGLFVWVLVQLLALVLRS